MFICDCLAFAMSGVTRSGQVSSTRHQNVKQLANSTSDFRKIDITSMNVVYADANTSNEICMPFNFKNIIIPSEVYVSNLPGNIIRYAFDEPSTLEKLDRKSKTFANLMVDIMENEGLVRGTEESRTDSFVAHMLEKLEFGEYPLRIRLQPLFKFKVYTADISSKYDFAVLKGNRILLVDEDKHINNTSPSSAWGEYQLAGELIAGAYCNYSHSKVTKTTYNDTLFAVRVIGLRFTFYNAKITEEYLNSLGEGFPNCEILIKRYPANINNNNFSYLDYSDAIERIEIVNMLIRIRENILNEYS